MKIVRVMGLAVVSLVTLGLMGCASDADEVVESNDPVAASSDELSSCITIGRGMYAYTTGFTIQRVYPSPSSAIVGGVAGGLRMWLDQPCPVNGFYHVMNASNANIGWIPADHLTPFVRFNW